jgi:hypothetical protein
LIGEIREIRRGIGESGGVLGLNREEEFFGKMRSF